MEKLKERSFAFRHRLISFLRNLDVKGIRRLSIILPELILPKPGKVGRHIIRTPDGLRFIIDPSSDKGVELSLYQTGTYEKGILHFIRRHLGQDAVFVDAGANIGLMSLFVAHHFPDSKVFAFEAHPVNFLVLKENIALNRVGNIAAFQKALGSAPGSTFIYDDQEDNRGGASMIHGKQSSYGHPVEVLTLDSVIGESKVDLIKIDVEGFEPEVLEGAENCIKRHHPTLIIEISQERDVNLETQRIMDFLEELQVYNFYRLKGTKERRSRLVKINSRSQLPLHDNIICIAKS